jgi:L-fuconolactonase
MRIDSHQHFWKYDATRDTWITDRMHVLKRDHLPEDLRREMMEADINFSVTVQADQSENETHFLLALAERHHFIAGVIGWVDLCSPEVSERLQYFSRFEKLRGFRHIAQTEPDDRFLLRDDFVRGVSALDHFDFTYDLLIYPRQLPSAVDLVGQLPEQRFVLDHLAKPLVKSTELRTWTSCIRRLAVHPNVFCKLSGLITESDWRSWSADDFRPFLDVVFDAFGADRLMFGSDWPVCLLAGTYGQVVELISKYIEHHSEEDRQKVFGLNAARFYKLRVLAHGPTA